MYTTRNSSNNSPMYGGSNMPIPTSDVASTINDQYHWDHSMRAHSHDRITVTDHSNESLWYSDSVLCQPEQSKRIHNQISVDQSNDSSSYKSLNSHQQSLIYSTFHHNAGPRAVIPSKRAAQNRAAQRAFRQRKERYVKDLERKAKLMDEWKAEMDQLRQQNKELREHNMNLEKQIHQQQSSIDFDQQKKLISPIHSPNLTAEIISAPVVVVLDQPTTKPMRRRTKQKPPTLHNKYQTSFMPVNLRAPDQTSFIGSPTTSCSSSSSSSSLNGLEDIPLQAPTFSSNQIPWTTPTPNDFDHYDASLNFMSGEQGLDDLCAILQTRQRPETNHYDNNNNTMNYIINEQDSPVYHHHLHQQQQNESMMLARSY